MIRILRTLALLSTIVLLSSCTHQASAAGDIDRDGGEVRCGTISSPVEWKYCITENPGSSNRDILYFFHGLGGNEGQWNKQRFFRQVRKRWAQTGKEVPVVVQFSFGKDWFLNEKSKDSVGFMPIVLNNVFPKIEKELVENFSGKRIIMGFSMGGFNSIQLVLKHPELFERAALICPAILDFDPYGGKKEIEKRKIAYEQRTGASERHSKAAVGLIRKFFPTSDQWEQVSPMKICHKYMNEKTPDLLISANREDAFGFYVDAERFKDFAISKGVQVEWQSRPGKHCRQCDWKSTADFLLP